MLYYLLLTMLVLILGFIYCFAVSYLMIFFYLYIEYNLGRLQQPELYPYIPLSRYIKNAIIEFFYAISKFYLYPFKFINLKPNLKNSLDDKPSTAILLIHGYARNQSDWLWFRKQLTELQLPIYTVQLNPAFGSIQQITVNSLKPKISAIKQETGCKQVILIGHSMGGLAASYYSEYLDDTNLVQAVITIATPFSGTKLSVAGAGENSKQMCPDSNFCKELRVKISQSQKPYFNIASQFDNIVFPWQSAILDFIPATQQFKLPLESHLGMLHSKIVSKQVKEWVSSF